MRGFFLAFIFFLLWFLVAFVYLANETTPKIASYISSLSFSKGISENITLQDPEETENETEEVSGDLFYKENLLKNQAVLHVFKDGIGYLFSLDTLYIKKNVDSVFFSTYDRKYFDKLLVYVSENENVELLIESDYSATEKFATPNMGIRRGEFLLNKLSENGLVPYYISVKSNIKELIFSEENTFYGGMQILLKPIDSIRKAEIEKNRVINRTVYPTFTFSKIIANKELNDFADELKSILASNPKRKVQIIGHTDNIGSAIDNYQLGLKYAQQVRGFLVNNKGIDGSKLSAISRGEENPIDDNNTHQGRKNNLRIEFIIE